MCILCAYVYACTHVYVYMCACVSICLYICMCVHMRACVYVVMYVYLCVHMCMCVINDDKSEVLYTQLLHFSCSAMIIVKFLTG